MGGGVDYKWVSGGRAYAACTLCCAASKGLMRELIHHDANAGTMVLVGVRWCSMVFGIVHRMCLQITSTVLF